MVCQQKEHTIFTLDWLCLSGYPRYGKSTIELDPRMSSNSLLVLAGIKFVKENAIIIAKIIGPESLRLANMTKYLLMIRLQFIWLFAENY